MKLSDIYNAYNCFNGLSSATLDAKLAIKVNRIIRELKSEAEGFADVIKKTRESFAIELEKIGLEHGAKKELTNDGGFKMVHEDQEIQKLIESLAQQELSKASKIISDAGGEEITLEIKTKISEKEIENANFRTNHKFNFAALNELQDFLDCEEKQGA